MLTKTPNYGFCCTFRILLGKYWSSSHSSLFFFLDVKSTNDLSLQRVSLLLPTLLRECTWAPQPKYKVIRHPLVRLIVRPSGFWPPITTVNDPRMVVWMDLNVGPVQLLIVTYYRIITFFSRLFFLNLPVMCSLAMLDLKTFTDHHTTYSAMAMTSLR